MELQILKDEQNVLEFKLHGENHTFCNYLKSRISKIKGVKVSAYNINHPLVGVPQFYVQTEGIAPRDAIKQALKEMTAEMQSFKKSSSKL